jgi:hypothetical protein
VNKLTSKKEKREVPSKLTERKTLKAFVYPFEVIVSPFKAFKNIVQNPDVKGLILIVVLLLLATVGSYYTYSAKVFFGASQGQPISSKLLTYPDAYVYVTTFGNYTFKSSQPYLMNYTFLDKTPLIEQSIFWVNSTKPLTPVNPVVTMANDTFYQTTVKLNQSTTEVGNLTLTVRFFADTGPTLSTLLSKTAQWDLGNFTINWFIRSPYTYLANGTTSIDLTSETTLSLLKTNVDRANLGTTASPNNWMRSVLSEWSDFGNTSVYGGQNTFFTYSGSWLMVVFNVNDAQIDATTVGIIYSNLLSTNSLSNALPQALIQTALFFVFNWMIYAGVLLLVMRALGEKGGSWRPFFVIVGYAFSITIIQSAISALLIATLPEVHLPITSWPPTGQDESTVTGHFNETWGPAPAFLALTYLTFPYINIIDVWFVLLSVIAVRAFNGTTLRKAGMIAATAFLLRFFLRFFLGF